MALALPKSRELLAVTSQGEEVSLMSRTDAL